jgi:hypothetical protein
MNFFDKTHVYLLVPQYSRTDEAIQAAFEQISNVDPNGPIRFYLTPYPEPNPVDELHYDAEWTGTQKAEFMPRSSRSRKAEHAIPKEEHFAELRKHLEVPQSLLIRMDRATQWLLDQNLNPKEDTLVVLMNPYGNTHNLFCAPSPRNSNAAFIQTTHFATETLHSRNIAIAYEIFASALRFRAFNEPDFQNKFLHPTDLGCVNDFSGIVQNLRYKILTADICDACFQHVQSKNIPHPFMEHLQTGLESVAAQQNNFKRALTDRNPIPIRVTYRFLLFDSIQARVLLSPKEMTLYKFFLSQSQGIHYHDLIDFRKDLIALYQEHYTGEMDEMEATIHTVVDRWCQQDIDLSQTISKINKKLRDTVGLQLARAHSIIGGRGSLKYIPAAIPDHKPE